MNVSATVPPTQTVAPRTCRTSKVVSTQCGTCTRIVGSISDDWNRKHGEAGLLFGAEPNRFLVAEADGLEPGRALDLACGSGRNAVWLAEQGWQVVGADFSDVALEQARELAAERGVEVEWLERRPAGMGAARRGVRPGGGALPAAAGGGARRRSWAGRPAAVAPGGTLLVVGHHSRTTSSTAPAGRRTRASSSRAEDVAAALDGLEVEKAEAVLRPVEGERDAIDALVRRAGEP